MDSMIGWCGLAKCLIPGHLHMDGFINTFYRINKTNVNGQLDKLLLFSLDHRKKCWARMHRRRTFSSRR